MLAQGFSTRRGRRSAWLHRDAVNQRLRPRRGARLAALLNGGAIPDMFDYDVVLQPEGTFIGTLNEMQPLITGFGGYRRLEPGLSLVGEAGATQYDLSEWILLDLRIGEAWRRVGDTRA